LKRASSSQEASTQEEYGRTKVRGKVGREQTIFVSEQGEAGEVVPIGKVSVADI